VEAQTNRFASQTVAGAVIVEELVGNLLANRVPDTASIRFAGIAGQIAGSFVNACVVLAACNSQQAILDLLANRRGCALNEISNQDGLRTWNSYLTTRQLRHEAAHPGGCEGDIAHGDRAGKECSILHDRNVNLML
jgi:hypothetical protein